MNKQLLCASGGKCEGVCREEHLHHKRQGLKDGKKTDRKGRSIYINDPYKDCPSAFENKVKRDHKKREEEEEYDFNYDY